MTIWLCIEHKCTSLHMCQDISLTSLNQEVFRVHCLCCNDLFLHLSIRFRTAAYKSCYIDHAGIFSFLDKVMSKIDISFFQVGNGVGASCWDT